MGEQGVRAHVGAQRAVRPRVRVEPRGDSLQGQGHAPEVFEAQARGGPDRGHVHGVRFLREQLPLARSEPHAEAAHHGVPRNLAPAGHADA